MRVSRHSSRTGSGRKRGLGRTVLFYWLPLFCWLFVIFYMSAQPYEKQDLRPWIQKSIVKEKVEKHLSQVQIHYGGREISVQNIGTPAMIEFFIRKSAHLLEYMILGLLVFRLLFILSRTNTRIAIFLSLVFCALYAAFDEIHQQFTAGRTTMFADVVLDTSGAALGIMTYYLYIHLAKGRGDTG